MYLSIMHITYQWFIWKIVLDRRSEMIFGVLRGSFAGVCAVFVGEVVGEKGIILV